MKSPQKKKWIWTWTISLVILCSAVWLIPPSDIKTWMRFVGAAAIILFAHGFYMARFQKMAWRFCCSEGALYSSSILIVFVGVASLGCFSPRSTVTKEQRQLQAMQRRNLVAQAIPQRPPAAAPAMVDLTPFYNKNLSVPRGSRERGLGPGIYELNGIRFDVRGLARADAIARLGPEDIPVQRTCSQIHVLYNRPAFSGNTNCFLIVHYLNGTTENALIPVPSEKLASITDGLVWAERISPSGTWEPDVVFNVLVWQNPFPDAPIKSIDFYCTENWTSPTLVAVTLSPEIPNP